jgi:hypothetical protein
MKTSLIVILLLMASPILGQPGDPSTDPDVPITGIEYLLGGGLVLGIRYILKRKKRVC